MWRRLQQTHCVGSVQSDCTCEYDCVCVHGNVCARVRDSIESCNILQSFAEPHAGKTVLEFRSAVRL